MLDNSPLTPVHDILKRLTLVLALLNGVVGFLGGIVRLGSWFDLSIPLFPSIFMVAHPFLVLLGFFTTFIILERWIGLQTMNVRLQLLLDGMLLATILGATLLLGSFFLQVIGLSLVSMVFLASLVFYIIAAVILMLLQAKIIFTVPQFKTEAAFIIMGFGLLAAISATFIVGEMFDILSFQRQLTYLPAYLVLVILGERITFARIGRIGGKSHSSDRDPLYFVLGCAFVLGILIDVSSGVILAAIDSNPLVLVNMVILGIIAILIFMDDSGTRKSSRATTFHEFQRLTLIGGYTWLFIGISLLTWQFLAGQSYLLYDAGLHAITLGFIVTMLLAHAPVVLPVVFKKPPITDVPHGLGLVLAFWVFTGIRVLGNTVQFILNSNNMMLLVALTGYASILPIMAYLATIVRQIMRDSQRTPSIAIR